MTPDGRLLHLFYLFVTGFKKKYVSSVSDHSHWKLSHSVRIPPARHIEHSRRLIFPRISPILAWEPHFWKPHETFSVPLTWVTWHGGDEKHWPDGSKLAYVGTSQKCVGASTKFFVVFWVRPDLIEEKHSCISASDYILFIKISSGKRFICLT